jgi:hypothetical protein
MRLDPMDVYQRVDLDLVCFCGRIYPRTLALPVDEKGRAVKYDDGFKFTCVVCTAGKSTPLHHVKPTDERAELVKKHALALNEVSIASLEQVSWDTHVKEEDVRNILTKACIEFSEGEDA